MRTLFPGFFTPTEAEFKQLWRDATFAFDANVLLDLYKLTSSARQVFFGVLDKLGDRVFLPNQAALEYLRRRLSVLEAPAELQKAVRSDVEKFVKTLESRMQDQAPPKGKDIIDLAKHAAKKINEALDAGQKNVADLSRDDEIRIKLVGFFDGKTGSPYDSSRLEEIYKCGAVRYSRGVPPGYKDNDKGDPGRFGDLVIWYQLMEHATDVKKPIIFVTRDSKEDWWLQQNGKTIGPRPELRQEMKQVAGVDFYMYETTKFLGFAQEFFSLKPEPTKKATNEIKEIEKKERAFEVQFTNPSLAINKWAGLSNAAATAASNWNNLAALSNAAAVASNNWNNLAGLTSAAATAVSNWNNLAFLSNAVANVGNNWNPLASMNNASAPIAGNWNPLTAAEIPADLAAPSLTFTSASPLEATIENKYARLLPLDGHVFGSTNGQWKCVVEDMPRPFGTDRCSYKLRFESNGEPRPERRLVLWTSEAALTADLGSSYKNRVMQGIGDWLSTDQELGELEYL
jgi:hypothetical protein